MAEREGGCSCGEVRYRLTADSMFTHCCHCLNCQRQTGSAFVINLLLEADRVEVTAGEPQAVDVPARRRQPPADLPLPLVQCRGLQRVHAAGGAVRPSGNARRSFGRCSRRAHLHPLEGPMGHAPRLRACLRGLLRLEDALAAGEPRKAARGHARSLMAGQTRRIGSVARYTSVPRNSTQPSATTAFRGPATPASCSALRRTRPRRTGRRRACSCSRARSRPSPCSRRPRLPPPVHGDQHRAASLATARGGDSRPLGRSGGGGRAPGHAVARAGDAREQRRWLRPLSVTFVLVLVVAALWATALLSGT